MSFQFASTGWLVHRGEENGPYKSCEGEAEYDGGGAGSLEHRHDGRVWFDVKGTSTAPSIRCDVRRSVRLECRETT